MAVTSSSKTNSLQLPDVLGRIVPGRKIDGIVATLLPFNDHGAPDWEGFASLLDWVAQCGLRPAVNMDTGYVHLLTAGEKRQVLEIARGVLKDRPFVAGAFVEGEDDFLPAYLDQIETIQTFGATPILFQSSALKRLSPEKIVETYRVVASHSSGMLAFELGEMFAPFGQIYSLVVFEQILQLEAIQGLKHSSLDRGQEWARLQIRDRLRPDFKLYTGNDLAIDMVMFGSDYLLGLATFAPDAFARRDALWAANSPDFFAVNDLLQYLGAFAFRKPVPAYRHSAAQFLKIRGRIKSSHPHPRSERRPDSDERILAELADRLEQFVVSLEA